ncbi:hypothetical protein [Joostella sp.]|uniref:hypothetical protein n=1 Tax=Joostella sp. TaxID=2231138 RepID=UPI003A8D1F9B
MKLKYIIPVLFTAVFATSCSNDDDSNDLNIIDEIEELQLVESIENDTHIIELYTETGDFETGYNNITTRILDKSTEQYVENADIDWSPVMDMETMSHSCPASDVDKMDNYNTLYNGYIVFQMTNDDGSGWTLSLDYTIDNAAYEASSTITVNRSETQNVIVFSDDTSKRYVLALVEPSEPIIGVNEMVVGLYEMESMMSFPEVEDYTIGLDPRMPDMGNHSSPNNTDLTYTSSDEMYHGDLSLTMTGYWTLNLKVYDEDGTLLAGDDVTEEDGDKGSLYLELIF